MKFNRTFIIILATFLATIFVIIIGIATLAYQFFQLKPPIAKYTFTTSIPMLENAIDELSTEGNFYCNNKREVGNKKDRVAFYQDINFKRCSYTIRYENTVSFWKKTPCVEVKLISVTDSAHDRPVYERDKTDDDILIFFNKNFIIPIETKLDENERHHPVVKDKGQK